MVDNEAIEATVGLDSKFGHLGCYLDTSPAISGLSCPYVRTFISS